MGEPSSSAPPARQPSPSMLSIYLQRTSSGQLSTGTSQLRQQEAAGHLSLPVPSLDPSPRQLLPPPPPLPGGSLLSSPFYAHLRDSPQDLFPFGATSIPVAERPPSLTPPSQSSNDPQLGSAPTRQLSANVAFSPSRSSLGSGYSLQSGAGDDPGMAETSAGPSAGSGSAGGAGGSWQPSASVGGSVAYGPGGFPGVSDEDLTAMDPKRAKRLIANRQSAQRSKARKLRHIMQLEEEVATLQGISAQQQATISGLQQEASLLTAGNHQLSVQVAELQEALQKQEAFTELVIAELRRLSVLAGEPPQLPAFSPGALQEQQLQAQQLMTGPQMAPQLSDIALQQQLASQYGLGGFAGVGYQQQYPAAQQFPAAFVPQYGLAQLGGMQQMPQQRVGLPAEGTFYQPSQQLQQQQQQQRQLRQQQQPRQIRQQQQPRPPGPVSRQPQPPQPPAQRAQPRPQPAGRSPTGLQGAPSPREAGLPPRASLERPASAPLPAAVAEAAAAAVAEEGGGAAAAGAGGAAAQPQSTEAVRDAALHTLALAERRSVRFSADLPPGDAATAETRRQALATAGRGNTFPLARGEAAARRAAVRTLSAPVPDAAAGGAAAEAAGAAAAQPPQQDPFRVNVPPSAFQVEERRPSQDVLARRQQQAPAQQFAAVPEQEDVQSWQQQQPQMGWPLGPRAQQPYPAAGGPVGNVMQAFRGLSLQGTASDPAALPPSGMVQRMQSQLPYGATLQPGGRYGNLSWDEMMRSLSDPVFQTGQDGTPIIPPGFYSQRVEAMGLSGPGPFESFYNLEQPDAAQQLPQPPPPPHQQEQQPPGGDAAPHQR